MLVRYTTGPRLQMTRLCDLPSSLSIVAMARDVNALRLSKSRAEGRLEAATKLWIPDGPECVAERVHGWDGAADRGTGSYI